MTAHTVGEAAADLGLTTLVERAIHGDLEARAVAVVLLAAAHIDLKADSEEARRAHVWLLVLAPSFTWKGWGDLLRYALEADDLARRIGRLEDNADVIDLHIPEGVPVWGRAAFRDETLEGLREQLQCCHDESTQVARWMVAMPGAA